MHDFLGVKDVREALSYAECMLNDLRIELTLVGLRTPGEEQKRSKSHEMMRVGKIKTIER